MDPQSDPVVLDPYDPVVFYACGNCGHETTLKQGDTIKCRKCDHRILYKKRTRRIVEYEAR